MDKNRLIILLYVQNLQSSVENWQPMVQNLQSSVENLHSGVQKWFRICSQWSSIGDRWLKICSQWLRTGKLCGGRIGSLSTILELANESQRLARGLATVPRLYLELRWSVFS